MTENENKEQPGVSGKSNKGNTWIDPEKMDEQKEFRDEFGKAGNLYGRSDLGNQDSDVSNSVSEEQVREALRRSPEADIQNVEVRLEGTAVHLYGEADDTKAVRAMENIAKNVPGVTHVISHIRLRSDEKRLS